MMYMQTKERYIKKEIGRLVERKIYTIQIERQIGRQKGTK